jgi:hypothetical protein
MLEAGKDVGREGCGGRLAVIIEEASVSVTRWECIIFWFSGRKRGCAEVGLLLVTGPAF